MIKLDEQMILSNFSKIFYSFFFHEGSSAQVKLEFEFDKDKYLCILTRSIKSEMVCTIQFANPNFRCPAMSLYRTTLPGILNLTMLTKFLISTCKLSEFCKCLTKDSDEDSFEIEEHLLNVSDIKRTSKLLSEL